MRPFRQMLQKWRQALEGCAGSRYRLIHIRIGFASTRRALLG